MPSQRIYRTSDIARAGGIHTNTVRLYEDWGYIPPAPRAANGYRQFSAYHLDQIRVVRLALRLSWISGPMRTAALGIIFRSAEYDLDAARAHAAELDIMLSTEQAQAEAALSAVEDWLAGTSITETRTAPLSIGQAARTLEVSIDMLRNWERNGLLDVPRNPANGYRQYGAPEIARLRMIRTLRRARYSTMAILRMLHRLESLTDIDLRAAINTPDPEDDIQYVTDRWLTTLGEMRTALDDLTAHLRMMSGKYGG
jgi:DNA-binding transcriptional MerR regulator